MQHHGSALSASISPQQWHQGILLEGILEDAGSHLDATHGKHVHFVNATRRVRLRDHASLSSSWNQRLHDSASSYNISDTMMEAGMLVVFSIMANAMLIASFCIASSSQHFALPSQARKMSIKDKDIKMVAKIVNEDTGLRTKASARNTCSAARHEKVHQTYALEQPGCCEMDDDQHDTEDAQCENDVILQDVRWKNSHGSIGSACLDRELRESKVIFGNALLKNAHVAGSECFDQAQHKRNVLLEDVRWNNAHCTIGSACFDQAQCENVWDLSSLPVIAQTLGANADHTMAQAFGSKADCMAYAIPQYIHHDQSYTGNHNFFHADYMQGSTGLVQLEPHSYTVKGFFQPFPSERLHPMDLNVNIF